LPDHAKRDIRASLDNVAIAWDASRPAARALADALPLIQHGRQVRIFKHADPSGDCGTHVPLREAALIQVEPV